MHAHCENCVQDKKQQRKGKRKKDTRTQTTTSQITIIVATSKQVLVGSLVEGPKLTSGVFCQCASLPYTSRRCKSDYDMLLLLICSVIDPFPCRYRKRRKEYFQFILILSLYLQFLDVDTLTPLPFCHHIKVPLTSEPKSFRIS